MIPMVFLSLRANRFQTIAVREIVAVFWQKTLNTPVFQGVVSSFWSQELATIRDDPIDESWSAEKVTLNTKVRTQQPKERWVIREVLTLVNKAG